MKTKNPEEKGFKAYGIKLNAFNFKIINSSLLDPQLRN